MKQIELDLSLYPKQELAFNSPAQEVLYGGAAGSGKSHFSRVTGVSLPMLIPGLQVYIFRRKYKDLLLAHYVGATGFRGMLAELVQAGYVRFSDLQIQFKNGPQGTFEGGSTIHGCHCQYEHDVFSYKSAEMHVTILEEATEFTPFQIKYLRTRSRISKGLKIPENLKAKLPLTIYPTNPGGESHDYFIEQFKILEYLEEATRNTKLEELTSLEPSKVWKADQADGGRTRQFIPARLEDNPSIDADDYIGALLGLKHPEHVRALRYGDWTVKLGSFYPELMEMRDGEPYHFIPHFNPPEHWTRVQAHDWGSAAPAATVWAAIADGEAAYPGQTNILPRGSVYCYQEWLVCQVDDTTTGLGYSNQQLAMGMYEREDRHNGLYLSDSLPFQDRGGIPMWKEYSDCGINLHKADVSSKEVSAQALRGLIIGQNDKPLYYISHNCPHSFRTLKAMKPHPTKPEKPADHPEDHIPDCHWHIARAWKSVTDSPAPSAKKLEQAWNHNDSLSDLIPGLSMMLGN